MHGAGRGCSGGPVSLTAAAWQLLERRRRLGRLDFESSQLRKGVVNRSLLPVGEPEGKMWDDRATQHPDPKMPSE